MAQAPWPETEAGLLVEDEITLPVQINGKKRADVTVPRDADVVIYCANGNRSSLASITLRDMGYERVSSMSAGINGWTAAGG